MTGLLDYNTCNMRKQAIPAMQDRAAFAFCPTLEKFNFVAAALCPKQGEGISKGIFKMVTDQNKDGTDHQPISMDLPPCYSF